MKYPVTSFCHQVDGFPAKTKERALAAKRGPRGWAVRILAWLLGAALLLVLLILLALVLFRFVNPPTTAFIMGYTFQNSGQTLRHEWVPLEDVSPWMPLAVVASEDQRFLQHRGVDVDAVRVALDSYRQGGSLRGASTITQQTAKNLFLWNGRHVSRKILEAGIALGMDALWGKARVMEVYLNVAEFGEGVYGVGAASRHFFGVPASQLGPEQAALLASVLPSPKRMRVNAPTPYMRERVRWIRQQMHQLGGRGWVDQLAR